MTKPTLKERLEKKWLCREVKLRDSHGDLVRGEVVQVAEDPEDQAHPIVVIAGGRYYCKGLHQLTLLKPKQKKLEVTEFILAGWWNKSVWENQCLTHASQSPEFRSLCDLLGVRKK